MVRPAAGSQQRLSLDMYTVQKLDDPCFGDLTSLVVQLEDSLLPGRLEAMLAKGTPPPSVGWQVGVQ